MSTGGPGDQTGRSGLVMPVLAGCLALAVCLAGCTDMDLDADGGEMIGEGIVRLDGGTDQLHRDEGTGPSPSFSFDIPSPSFSFVALGDTQHPTTSCILPGHPAMRAVPKAILALSPAPGFVIHLGDLVNRGSKKGAYAAFVSCYGELLLKLPLFPTMGNHDEDFGLGILNYRAYLEKQISTRNGQAVGRAYNTLYPLTYKDDLTHYSTDFNIPTYTDRVPSGVSFKTFYAFRRANTYFLSFEQGAPMWTNTPIPWVEKHLKAARADRSVKYVFVFMHFPLYLSSGKEINLYSVRRHYEPLFRKYDVTAVFSGHAHMYHHSYVPDDGHATQTSKPPSSYPHDGKAIHYLVSGGGSWHFDPLPPELKETRSSYAQASAKGNHFLRVQVTGDRLTVTAIGVKGSKTAYTTSVLDSFTIE